MLTPPKLLRWPFFVVVAAVFAAIAAPAQAQHEFNLNRFRASETPDDGFSLTRPNDYGHMRFGAHIHLDYGHDPFVVEGTAGDSSTEIAAIVQHQLTGTAGVSLGLFDRLVVYLGLPVHLLLQGQDVSGFAVTPPDGGGLGDFYFGARVRLLGDDDDVLAVALQLGATAPSSQKTYRGENFLTIHPELLAEVRSSGLRVTVNLGGRVREDQILQNDSLIGDELTFGLGIAVPVVGTHFRPWETRLDLLLQAYGETAFKNFFGREETGLEAIGGLKLHHSSGFVIGGAAGAGLNRGIGSPDLRAILTLGWGTPPEAPDTAPGDRDGDGILDPDDQCPDEPEDRDGFEDEDGCPDPDNDRDGILDVNDECPLEPEDADGIADEDGCPEEDYDEDGLPDVIDECPLEPEDHDDFEDDDGCPDPDNDQDTVLDVDDRCPLVPGVPENDGCPGDRDGDTVLDDVDNCPDEPGPVENQGCPRRQLVRITEDHLEILDTVYFRTNSDVIQSRSYELLENVAQVIVNHPEIQLVRVEGHTDSRGDDNYNMRLSQRRSESVMRFLVEHGVAESRLTARGFGETHPIESNNTRAGRAANRRVEFNLGQEHESVQPGMNAPTEDTMDEPVDRSGDDF